MGRFGKILLFFTAVGLFSGLLRADCSMGMEPVYTPTSDACATVTFVEGTAFEDSDSAPQILVAGQTLYSGSRVRTDSASRIELTLTGGGIVRLAGETTLELGPADASASGVSLSLMLLTGDMWVNSSGLQDAGSPRILAVGALINGPRSVFRTVVYDGQGDLEVKVYTGQVTASGPFEIRKENARYSLDANPGDEETPLEPWRHQITPYRKMIIMASGEATPPFRFAAKSDLISWVHWNQQRDEGE